MFHPSLNRAGLRPVFPSTIEGPFQRELSVFLSVLALMLRLVLSASAASDSAPSFQDVSREAGLSFIHASGASSEKYLVETMGSGGGFLDYDRDGWMDVYLVNSGATPSSSSAPPGKNRLFRNNGDGSFSDVTDQAGVGDPSYGMGCVFADYDNDGDVDLYVTNLGPNVLYRNNGDGTFTDVSAAAGVGDPLWSTSAAFGDYDADGWLDLYVGNYLKFTFATHRRCYSGELLIYCFPHSYDGVPNTLYRNRGDGTFERANEKAGVIEEAQYSKSLGVLWLDLEGDGDLDLYVANDTTANYVFRNGGDGVFEDVSLLSGGAFNGMGMAQSGMGVDAADLAGNGLYSIFVTNFSLQTNDLYWNNGQGILTDHTLQAGLSQDSFLPLGFGANFLDYDNDGLLDLFVANGHVFDNIATINPSLEYAQPNQLFRNRDAGRFDAVSARAGPYFSRKNVSRGSAVADYNNDGRLDLLVTNNNQKADLLENRSVGNHHWLQLRLEGTHCNRDGVGAKARLKAGGRLLSQEVRAGSSYLSQSDLRVHFGLGAATGIDSIEILWPCGRRQMVPPPSTVNRILRVKEQE